MKKLYPLILSAGLLGSCIKEDISGTNTIFVGDWKPAQASLDSQSEIVVNSNGTGHYIMIKPGSQVEFKGNVYFQSGNVFTIGGKIIKKKIHVDKFPLKVIESITPYKFHYEATFNGIEYIR